MSLATLGNFATPAQQIPLKVLDDAKAIVLSACLQNKARTISECTCHLKTMKEKIPEADYSFFMEALYYSTKRDNESFAKMIKKYDKNH